MRFRVGFGTHIGRVRKQNQDNGAAHPELGLFLVSDGMGGHRGGETASALAVQYIVSSVRDAAQKKNWDPTQILVNAFHVAHQEIYERSKKDPLLQGMGTTTTALLFKDKRLTIGHVGDSRCYFLRPGQLWQATRDHSLVQEKLRAGLITREEAKTDRMKNVITRSVGFEQEVNVEVYHMNIQPGDSFLLCSDGLTGMIEDSAILEIFQNCLFSDASEDAPQKTTDALIAAANSHGGEDNVTAVVAQVI